MNMKNTIIMKRKGKRRYNWKLGTFTELFIYNDKAIEITKRFCK